MGLSRALALLRAGVPLTLLIDLWPGDGPDSADIMRTEALSLTVTLGAA